ncbi:MAG TPA: 3-hydroxyacyl-CoA dehydrogenase NAD-binding domain-containing protein [Bacteroidia bacterium]|nr:3-hydroxyacyl-CoA dehydrogenase NAD-binding domain-containing protein [Bacteroidia bacterium]HNT79722.1 3-hydroxyacyl-CoA dehydrogenase NAD-binding domain-containing protein [Bacteroidia bacterium]
MKDSIIGVIGAGTMGSGIALACAQKGFTTYLYDNNENTLQKSYTSILSNLNKLKEKGKFSDQEHNEIVGRLHVSTSLKSFSSCTLVIEAAIEDLNIKKEIFENLEQNIVSEDCILASNTSSLSITSIASACKNSNRFIGIHFFNPATLMPLVEVIPGIETDKETLRLAIQWIEELGKVSVTAKDTPGFIVNRVARPFYSESIKIYEEGIASFAQIDEALKEIGKFKMGPFELMDFIGNDINYTVTETVWRQFFYDPRFKPSFTQKRMVEAKRLGRKSGKGYYDYLKEQTEPTETLSKATAHQLVDRVLLLLFNEAADAVFMNIASKDDIDTAMIKGTNYPKGLLKWSDEYGIKNIVDRLDLLYDRYHDDRYRVCPLLRDMAQSQQNFFS